MYFPLKWVMTASHFSVDSILVGGRTAGGALLGAPRASAAPRCSPAPGPTQPRTVRSPRHGWPHGGPAGCGWTQPAQRASAAPPAPARPPPAAGWRCRGWWGPAPVAVGRDQGAAGTPAGVGLDVGVPPIGPYLGHLCLHPAGLESCHCLLRCRGAVEVHEAIALGGRDRVRETPKPPVPPLLLRPPNLNSPTSSIDSKCSKKAPKCKPSFLVLVPKHSGSDPTALSNPLPLGHKTQHSIFPFVSTHSEWTQNPDALLFPFDPKRSERDPETLIPSSPRP